MFIADAYFVYDLLGMFGLGLVLGLGMSIMIRKQTEIERERDIQHAVPQMS